MKIQQTHLANNFQTIKTHSLKEIAIKSKGEINLVSNVSDITIKPHKITNATLKDNKGQVL